jgi:hypothetical protein
VDFDSSTLLISMTHFTSSSVLNNNYDDYYDDKICRYLKWSEKKNRLSPRKYSLIYRSFYRRLSGYYISNFKVS